LEEGKEVSEEKVEWLCRCKIGLLRCKLMDWIKEIQEDLVSQLRENKSVKYKKYWADKSEECLNRNILY